MAKMIIDCADPNDMEAVDRAIEKAIGSCNVTHFRQHQEMVRSGVSNSERGSARKIAEETGENPGTVRQRIMRGKKEVVHPVPPATNDSEPTQPKEPKWLSQCRSLFYAAINKRLVRIKNRGKTGMAGLNKIISDHAARSGVPKKILTNWYFKKLEEINDEQNGD